MKIPKKGDWYKPGFIIILYPILKCMTMNHNSVKFRPSDKMGDLISSDYKLLLVMSRFGLSLGFKNQGAGLAAAIKQRYPNKGVVIYSGTHEHDIFDLDLDKVDAKLPKNAEPVQFMYLIEQYGRKED